MFNTRSTGMIDHHTIQLVALRMKGIKTLFKIYNEIDNDTGSYAHTQPKRVDERIIPIADETAKGNGEVVAEHSSKVIHFAMIQPGWPLLPAQFDKPF